MRVFIVGFFIFLTLISLATAVEEDECDPIYEEWTADSECDFNCQDLCTPVQDICICREGYLRDLPTGRCIPEDQCTPAPESISLSCLEQ
uniref:TIL domain-containing protein n=1 Tax=Anopheles funestus TaxID=62324 RepID=A0A182RQH7_ANOFN